MQLFKFLFPLQHMKRPASQKKQVGVLRMAFRVRKVFGTFEKRAPGPKTSSANKALTSWVKSDAFRTFFNRKELVANLFCSHTVPVAKTCVHSKSWDADE